MGGNGHAQRALDLMSEYLRTATTVRQMVLRVAPANYGFHSGR